MAETAGAALNNVVPFIGANAYVSLETMMDRVVALSPSTTTIGSLRHIFQSATDIEFYTALNKLVDSRKFRVPPSPSIFKPVI